MCMPDYYYRTSSSEKGPWLLDREQMQGLDELFTAQRLVLQNYRKQKINAQVESELLEALKSDDKKQLNKKEKDALKQTLLERVSERSSFNPDSIMVETRLNRNRKLVTHCIGEAMSHAAIEDAHVEKLIVCMKVADVHAHWEFEKATNRVSINVEPEELKTGRDVFDVINQWLDRNKPPTWQQCWGDICYLLWMAMIVIGFGGTALLSQLSAQSLPFRDQAFQLLQSGINATNQVRAIELLLAIQSGYTAQPRPSFYPQWWFPSVGLALLACVAFSVRPGSHLGVGAGKKRVQRWRWWVKCISVTFPTLLASSFLWPRIEELLKSLF